jgi:glycine oxidase
VQREPGSTGLRGREADRQQLIRVMPAKRGSQQLSRAPQSYDVAVVGGGVIGLAVAWRAARSGLRVVVLERDTVGAGASHVAAGMLAPVSEADAREPALLDLGLRSAAAWPAFAAELGVELQTHGTLVVARDRDEAEWLERELALRERLELSAERLLPSAARALEPALAPTLRAAFAARDDHSVDPRALVQALARAARDAGAEIREHAPVADLATVPAAAVVLAAGAWSGALADLPVRPVKGQTIRLRPPPGEAAPLRHTIRFDGGYLVPRADGRIVLGATMEERGFDTAVTAGAVHELLRDAAELVPAVLELEIEELVAGLRPGTPDNLPIVRRLDERVFAATGHHRNGILLAPLTAELVVAELVGAGRPAEVTLP